MSMPNRKISNKSVSSNFLHEWIISDNLDFCDTCIETQAGLTFLFQESPWRTPLATAFVEAGVEMGYENRDCNGEFQTGFMIPQGTIRRGSRCSTSKAFLRPVRNRWESSLRIRCTRHPWFFIKNGPIPASLSVYFRLKTCLNLNSNSIW